MNRRYRSSAVLNVKEQILEGLDIAKIEPAFESELDAIVRNNALVKLLRAGDEVHLHLAEKLARCDHEVAKPCRLSICHICGRENRRLFVADGIKVLGIVPNSDPSASTFLFITVVDHHWVRSWREFDDFDMRTNGKNLVHKLQAANLGIERLVGAWDFEWRRWELNNEPTWKQKFWVPHVHAVVKTSLTLNEFRDRLRSQFERKVIFSVERPSQVKVVTNAFGALSYTRKQIFGERNISELRPQSRHQNPTGLGADKTRQLCVKLHGEGYKARHVLIGCHLRRGRIRSTD